MKKVGARELSFIRSRVPRRTVEISVDDDVDMIAFRVIERSLALLAENNPNLHASIYTYCTPSVNFHEYTNSEFFIVDGPDQVVDFIYAVIKRLGNIRVRHSDEIPPSQGIIAYHIEGGSLWQADDAVTWLSLSSEEMEESASSFDAGISRLLVNIGEASRSASEDDDAFVELEDDEVAEQEREEVSLSGDDLLLYENICHHIGEIPELGDAVNMGGLDDSVKVARMKEIISDFFGIPPESIWFYDREDNLVHGNTRVGKLRSQWWD